VQLRDLDPFRSAIAYHRFMRARPLLFAGLLFSACCTPARAAEPDPSAKLYVAGQGAAEATVLPVERAETKSPDFEAFPDRRRQAVAAFGGAFNEMGWDVLQVLSPEERARVLERIFAPGRGLSLGMGRISIGANDYALSRYALDETPGDLAMARFSIDRDRQALLPYLHAARALNPKLRFWASAHTPPPWMKDNGAFDSGAMKDDPKIYAAYALYLAKFVEAYRGEGIPVEAVAVQNEPYILTAYPSCRWEPAQFRTFVRDHLGPTLASRKTGAKVMLGTFNQADNEAHALAVLEDPAARAFVSVLGLQWDGLPIAGAARKLVPDLPVWHTETDCGNHHWEPGFDPNKPQNDFAYALDTWRKVRRYLDGGAEVYTLWNIVLDETGKSIDAKRPWPQNSPIVVDRTSRQVTYTPMFHAFEQWSRYAGAGSVVLEGKGSKDALALARPDGTIAVELVNPDVDELPVRVKIGERAWDVWLPARSFATLVVPGS
jgi:glucosylceramidase